MELGIASCLLVPSAFTVPTGTAHWHILLRGKETNERNNVALLGSVVSLKQLTNLFLSRRAHLISVGQHNKKRESSVILLSWIHGE